MALAWRRPPPAPPPSAPGPRVPLPSIVVVALLLLLLELLRRRRRRDPPATRRAPASVRSVAIYGLSANPPTSKGGHATLVRKLAEDFDEVWVLPVYSHAFAEKDGELAAYEHRHRMCVLAFVHSDGDGRYVEDPAMRPTNIHVLHAEREVAERARRRGIARHGSALVLREIARRNRGRDVKFTWVMGEDAYADLRGGKWIDGDAFERECAQLVVPRGGEALNPKDDSTRTTLGPNAKVAEGYEAIMDPEVSSTLSRAAIARRRDWNAPVMTDAKELAAYRKGIRSLCGDTLAYVDSRRLYSLGWPHGVTQDGLLKEEDLENDVEGETCGVWERKKKPE